MTPVELFSGLDPIAQGLFVLCLVAVTGLLFGRLSLGGVSLGIGGVLFAGILWGHLGFAVDPAVGQFLREFGLILFVYTIGIQVGPGFFQALKRSGLALNGMAAGMVVLSALVAAAIHMGLGVPLPVTLGLLSGATTNTPSLGAVTQMLSEVGAGPDVLSVPGLGYAVAYPFGIAGILLAMLLVRWLFRVDPDVEQERFSAARRAEHQGLQRANVEVTNPNLDNVPLGELPGMEALHVVVSRMMRDGTVQVAHPETPVRVGDVLLLVGEATALRDMTRILGKRARRI